MKVRGDGGRRGRDEKGHEKKRGGRERKRDHACITTRAARAIAAILMLHECTAVPVFSQPIVTCSAIAIRRT